MLVIPAAGGMGWKGYSRMVIVLADEGAAAALLTPALIEHICRCVRRKCESGTSLPSRAHTFLLTDRSIGTLLSDSLLKSALPAGARGADSHMASMDVMADEELSDEALQQLMSALESLQAQAPHASPGTRRWLE